MREWLARLLGLFRKRSMRDRLERELALHRELLAEDLASRDVPPSQSALRRELGPASFRDAYDDQSGVPWVEHVWSDVRYALRGMRRSPAIPLVVVATLALGIGVNTAIFSVVNSVLIEPLPYPDSERLVWLGESTGEARGISVTWPNFLSWRQDNHTFETMAGFQFGQATLTGRGEARTLRSMVASHEYLGLTGMRPLLGRLLTGLDDRPGSVATVVLNHRFWAGQLGGDPSIVGSTLTLDGRPYEVVGVAAPVWEARPVDYYLPLGRISGSDAGRGRHASMRVLGRLRQGVSLAAAQDDLDTIMRRLAAAEPGPEDDHRAFGRMLADQTAGDARATLLPLMGAASLVLVIACANIANLLLARATMRRTEFAVRAAIGAGRGRLARQLLTESLLLSIVGGGAGLLLAPGTLAALIALAPEGIPRLAETALNGRVLFLAAAVSILTGMSFGMAPVLSAARLDLLTALKAGGRAFGGGAPGHRARSVLVVGEVALTFVLVFAAVVLLRSLMAAQRASAGVDPREVLSLELRVPDSSYRSAEAVDSFFSRLMASLQALPGVVDVAAVRCPPGAGGCGDWFYSIPGREAPARNNVPIAFVNIADAGFFRAMRVPLRQGREFAESDRPSGRQVAIVNETLARTWWPSSSAVGQQIKLGGPYLEGPLLEIVGVVADVKQNGLDTIPSPEIYQPFAQKPDRARAVMIRAAGDPDRLMPAIRGAVSSIDRNLPIQRLTALEQLLGASLARRRFGASLLAGFAALAVALACVGLYGLLSYWVSVREPEIAIRLALGARRAAIVRWTSAHALRLVGTGAGFGIFGAWAASRGLQGLIFGASATSPITLFACAGAVACMAVLATALPARRASRVDAAVHLHRS